MTANKRKRSRLLEEDQNQANEQQQEQQQQQHLQQQPPQEGSHQIKKPHIQSPPPGSLISSAIQKIAELQKCLNDDNFGDEEEDDYSSDYSDLSEGSGRFNGNPYSGGADNSQKSSPVIKADVKFCPEIVGFAVCAQETMSFLFKQGYSEDNPLIRTMQQRLLDQITQYQISLNPTKPTTSRQ